jgi:phenylalanyl-tRNA synthetase beta subunit
MELAICFHLIHRRFNHHVASLTYPACNLHANPPASPLARLSGIVDKSLIESGFHEVLNPRLSGLKKVELVGLSEKHRLEPDSPKIGLSELNIVE